MRHHLILLLWRSWAFYDMFCTVHSLNHWGVLPLALGELLKTKESNHKKLIQIPARSIQPISGLSGIRRGSGCLFLSFTFFIYHKSSHTESSSEPHVELLSAYSESVPNRMALIRMASREQLSGCRSLYIRSIRSLWIEQEHSFFFHVNI